MMIASIMKSNALVLFISFMELHHVFSFIINTSTHPRTNRVTPPLQSATYHDAPQAQLTEGQILARNQGNLQMATKGQREAAKQKHLVDDPSCTNESSHTEFESSADEHGFGSIVMDDGVARINNVLSRETADRMRKYVNRLLVDTTQAVEQGFFDQDSLFGNVYCKENRWDLLLPLEGSEHVMDCVTEVLQEGSPVATAVESVLGKDAELYELSTLISDPGSKSQPLHPDILYQDTVHPILTCFIALQDIDDDMGPTVFMPKVSYDARRS
jgi:Phytanoyl-CoA dioxygenase (PhyH).